MNTPPPRMLTELLDEAGITFTASAPLDAIQVCGVCGDSRDVRRGFVFVAIEGAADDGRRYIGRAIDAGACAVITDRHADRDPRVPCIVVEEPAAALARLCYARHGVLDLVRRGRLELTGITGTNGKSTTCQLLQHLLASAARPAARLGTISYDLVGRVAEAPWTTPPAPALAACLAEAAGHGARSAVMEVSSHALAQHRTAGLEFRVAIFTNLTGDHLDYHRDREAYLQAKRRLFAGLPATATAVINTDDPAARQMAQGCAARVLAFGFHAPAVVTAAGVTCDIHSSRFRLITPAGERDVTLPFVGRHNVSNALAAAAAALAMGVNIDTIQRALASAPAVAGRLQRAEPGGAPISVFVDYAHTDDALENVLTALRPLTRGKLWCVFGCGGDRDRSKRPRMAAVCARHADQVVVTSDNPRSEPPQRIIDDILAGFDPGPRSQPNRIHVEPDRRRAIELAVGRAAPDDVVLVAGKGHENYQLIAGQRYPFDDVAVVRETFQALQCGRSCS